MFIIKLHADNIEVIFKQYGRRTKTKVKLKGLFYQFDNKYV